MNPGIYYLYEYNQNQRLRNVGFLKIVPHYRSRLLQVHMRGISIRPGQSLPLSLSLFYMDGAEIIYKELSEFLCKDKTVSFQITIPESHLPDGQTWNDINGILLHSSDGHYFSAMTNGSLFDSRKLRIWKAADENHPLPEHITTDQTGDTSKDVIVKENNITSEDTTMSQNSEASENIIIASANTDKATFDTAEAAPVTAELSASDAAAPPQFPVIRKIQRSQLSILPRRCWNLANNSFLMHGYHNYNHLLLIEEDGHYILGVPGIFSMREARAAELFGFPKFIKQYAQALDLEKEERSPSENFGHWCRTIPY